MARVRKPKVSAETTEVTKKGGVMLTPEQLAASGTEHGHQTAIMQWTVTARRAIPDLDLLFAVPNGGDRSMSVAAGLKAEGVKSGVPDLVWPVPCGDYHGLWIELKVPGREGQTNGGRSDKQVEWHQRLVAQGYAVVTAYGWQAACWAIVLYRGGGLAGMPEDGLMATPMAAPPVVAYPG